MSATRDETSTDSFTINDVKLRLMVHSDLEEVSKLWNVDVSTLQFLCDSRLCPNRNYVATFKDEVIATGFTYFVNDVIAILGGLAIKPNFRKKGIGKLIWDARIQDAGNRNLMVNAVERRAPKSTELGFDKFAHLLNVFKGIPRSLDPRHLSDGIDQIVPISQCSLETLTAYDSSIHANIPRSQYLKVAIEEYSISGFVAFKGSNIVGYIGSIPANRTTLIGPWYADSCCIARTLLQNFIRYSSLNCPIQIIVPEVNKAAQEIIAELGINQVDQWSCLFNRYVVKIPVQKVYSIANPVAFIC